MEPLTRLSSVDEATTDLEWEESPCPLCGSCHYEPLIEAADASQDEGLRFLVVRCEQCGLCFTNPRPSPRSIDLFYPDDYPPFQHSSHARHDPWWHGVLRRVKGRQDLDRLLGTEPARLLDLGCGSGSFLARMRQRGWQVTGLDLSPSAVDRGRQLGLNVLHGSLPHEHLAEGSFDLVTMWQSLEHVPHPLEVLRAARGLLAPGGRLVLSVPNIGSLPFRWFGPAWYGLDLPRHLTHFTAGTLRMMLRHAGFSVVDATCAGAGAAVDS